LQGTVKVAPKIRRSVYFGTVRRWELAFAPDRRHAGRRTEAAARFLGIAHSSRLAQLPSDHLGGHVLLALELEA
jgi:hypothetical protein